MKRLATGLMIAAMGVAFLAPPEVQAQRRVLGGDEKDDEDEDDKKAAEKRKKAKEKRSKKAKEKAERAEKKAAEKQAAAEAATIAAEKAAEAAEAKRIADEEAAVVAKEKAVEKKKKANKKSRLSRAKKRRRLFRVDEDIRTTLSIEPGKPVKNKLEEVKFEIVRQLKVAHPRFGLMEPLKKMNLVATVSAPNARGEPIEHRYRVHSLGAPGRYGFHYTPISDGEHTVIVDGKTKGGDPVRIDFSIFVGVWPPPDLEEEDRKLEKALEVGGGGGARRVVN